MSNLSNSSNNHRAVFENPYTSKAFDPSALFDFAHKHYDCVRNRDECISNLAEHLIEVQAIFNSTSVGCDGDISGLAEANQFPSELVIVFLKMRNLG